MLLKVTAPHPLDVGGRQLAAGETADLDPDDPVVTDHVGRGHLTPVQPVSGPVAPRQQRTIKPQES